jgi:hypothetical protein
LDVPVQYNLLNREKTTTGFFWSFFKLNNRVIAPQILQETQIRTSTHASPGAITPFGKYFYIENGNLLADVSDILGGSRGEGRSPNSPVLPKNFGRTPF